MKDQCGLIRRYGIPLDRSGCCGWKDCGGAGRFPGQRGEDGVVHRVKKLLFRGKFDLGFGGMDVHVHIARTGVHMQHAAGKFPYHFLILIGLLQGGLHHAGFHIPAVYEKMLIAPGTPAADRQRDKAGDADGSSLRVHGDKTERHVPAQHTVHGSAKLPISRGKKLFLSVPEKPDRYFRMGEGQPLDHRQRRRPFVDIPFDEFKPRRRVVEKIAHHKGRPLRASGLFLIHELSAFQRKGSPQLRAASPCYEGDPGDGRDGGQSFASESQSPDGFQVAFSAQLGGRVAQKGHGSVLRFDAAAVIGDPDKGHSSVLDFHRHGGGSGVDGIFHEFLHHGSGAFHHLAGRYQVRHMGVKLFDFCHGSLRRINFQAVL
ncbi:hypothetical protein SDC9_50016 [bioreactor metagenome]|uniref:Uncharacterized protein n=1 Tax=bioreactor metagenome TaxID=1076179 RepID=A0A644WJG9_9ZZZZ